MTNIAENNSSLTGLYLTCKLAITAGNYTKEGVLAYAYALQEMDAINTADALKAYCEPIAKDLRKQAKQDADFKAMDSDAQKRYLSKIVEHNRRMVLAALYLVQHSTSDAFRNDYDKKGFYSLWTTQAEKYKTKKKTINSASASQPAQADDASASKPADSAWCQACEAVDKIASLKLTKEERIGIVAELMDALNVNIRQIKESEQQA